jgi:protocatechuate 3,4-dioxygenase beta subunit
MDTGRPHLTRRHVLSLLGAGGGMILLGCTGDGGGGTSAATTSTPSAADPPSANPTGASSTTTGPPGATTTASSAAATSPTPGPPAGPATTSAPSEACAPAETPGETGGPFPADGTNEDGAGALADVLHDPRALRSDIRSDLDGTNTQEGAAMTLRMRVVDAAGCTPRAGAAVYVWHCNRDGIYSAYSSAMNSGDQSDRTFLRGVQLTDEDGWATFRTVLPGRYAGRAFHIHFAVYASGDLAADGALLTSQIAIDDAVIDAVYAQLGYREAAANVTHNGDDGVFRDGVERQLMSLAGDASSGLVGSIVVGV